ncbi:MAG: hypothetical protein D3924_20345 [Candidatus Electrothrix sp. AR4]|nr:hypothetical protein [Candidatus Electrothrix sp. AR4]
MSTAIFSLAAKHIAFFTKRGNEFPSENQKKGGDFAEQRKNGYSDKKGQVDKKNALLALPDTSYQVLLNNRE